MLFVATITSVPINYSFAIDDFDGDGIEDSMDLCPRLVEDYIGAEDGCPSELVQWNDFDGDGIENKLDACPDVQETYNGFEDTDGCPDSSVAGRAGSVIDSDNDGIPDFRDNCPTIKEKIGRAHV